MWIHIRNTKLNAMYKWDVPIKSAYVWSRKIRPQEAPRLPAEYQEVEYIESHWEEYIDTWLLPIYWNTYNVTSNFKWTNQDDDYYALFWFNMMTRRFYVWFWGWEFIVNQVPHQTATWTITPNIVAYNTKYYLECEFDTWQMDWSRNIYIFDSVNNPISAQLYDFKIYENNILLRDFVPCYRKSDLVIWLYDIAGNLFYTNSWGWAFTKWANITT